MTCRNAHCVNGRIVIGFPEDQQFDCPDCKPNEAETMSIDPLISAYQKDLLETKKALAAQTKYIEHLEEVLQEIRDVAACSDGVEFYVMLADKGLNYEG